MTIQELLWLILILLVSRWASLPMVDDTPDENENYEVRNG